jgi:hypothetical protein
MDTGTRAAGKSGEAEFRDRLRAFQMLEQDMQIPSVPLKRLPFLAKRARSRWSRAGEGANYLDGEREPVC